jgi:hypothetical protein
MQALVHQFAHARLADARVVQAYVSAVVQHGSLAAPDDVQLAALVSTLLLTAAINVLLMLLVPRGRKLVLDTAETVLAIALILILLAVVLGLPLGEWGARRQLSPPTSTAPACCRQWCLLLLVQCQCPSPGPPAASCATTAAAGIIYLILKAFLLNALLAIPAVMALVDAVRSRVGL